MTHHLSASSVSCLLFLVIYGVAFAEIPSVQGNSLLQVKHETRKALPDHVDVGIADGSTGWGMLNPATCVEVVLIEPRPVKGIVRAAESALGSDETNLVTLAHGAFNADYVQALVAQSQGLSEAQQKQRLRLLDLRIGDLGSDVPGSSKIIDNSTSQLVQAESRVSYHDEYSRLVKSQFFWDNLFCDHIVLMQSDSLFCHGSTVRLAEFFDYSFVGGRQPGLDAADRMAMNGGFSYRSRSHALACLALYPAEVAGTGEGEDIFFSRCPLFVQPPAAMAERFAVDNAATLAVVVPLGVHKPWVGPYSAETMAMCPGAEELRQEQGP